LSVSFRKIENKFAKLILEVDQTIHEFVDEIDLVGLAKNNKHYQNVGRDPFKYLIETQKKRFLIALDWITEHCPAGTVCDLGCFIPWLPVALARLGYVVKIVDRYDYHGALFESLIKRLTERESIEIHYVDILADSFDSLGKNDLVMLMAVVEHLNGSPKDLLIKAQNIINTDGSFLFEVPNIAAILRRLQLLLGTSPLADYDEYLESVYPFPGHNREMTVSEVKILLERTGFVIDRLECFDYDFISQRRLVGKWVMGSRRVIPWGRNMGQSILARAIPVQ